MAEQLAQLARSLGVPLKSVLLAAHLRVMGLLTGESDVLTGLVVNGRPEVSGGEQGLGLFLNTLPFRVQLRAHAWSGLIRTTYEQEQRCLPFRRYPLAELQQRHGGPLFETAFNFIHFHVYGQLKGLPGLHLLAHSFFEETNFPLIIQFALDPMTQKLELLLRYDPRALSPTQVEQLGHFFVETLRSMVKAPEAHHTSTRLLPPVERQRLLEVAKPSASKLPVLGHHTRSETLPRIFEAQVAKTPDAIAVTYGDRSLTYLELAQRARRLAERLRAQGVKTETRVGLCMTRSLELVVGVLGILGAGGVYVPLDPMYPAGRLELLLQDAGVQLVVVGGLDRLPPALLTARERATGAASQLDIVELQADGGLAPASEGSEQLGAPPLATASVGLAPEQAAYVIYTSGSTGGPKGVMVTHANVVRLMRATEEGFQFGPRDVWTLFHSYAFDFSVWELWGALLYGGRLVVVSYEVSRDPRAFLELLHREQVTVLNQTPSAFQPLMQADEALQLPLSLRYVIFGGEALNLASLVPWFERHGDRQPTLVNMYGITETTVHVTWRFLRQADAVANRGSLIGTPLPHLALYVLDPWGEPTPYGVTGELYVGGAGLARGYLDRPALTAERFVPNPFGPGRLYRTGDLARRLEGDELEYLGRRDQQVKIRGFRIELEEVARALRAHPSVREVVVVTQKLGAGEVRLVGYVVARETGGSLTGEQLRLSCRAQLPDFMVAAAVVLLDQMPLTAHGKLDVRALPAPTLHSERTAGVLPSSPEEAQFYRIVQEVLGCQQAGPEDSFFTLGGHSLLATQLLVRLERHYGVKLPLRRIFEAESLLMLWKEVQTGTPLSASAAEPGLQRRARQRRAISVEEDGRLGKLGAPEAKGGGEG